MNNINRKKGFVVPLVIAIIGLLALGGGVYLVSKNDKKPKVEKVENTALTASSTSVSLRENSISSISIFGPESKMVRVYLYAPDQSMAVQPEPGYCGAPGGAEVYSGNYQITTDSGVKLDLGQMTFVKGTAWNGKMATGRFDTGGKKDFIILQQYGSCNGTLLQIYGYDLTQNKLVQYKFIPKDGIPVNDAFMRSYTKSTKGNLVTSAYDNSVGKTITTEWVFHVAEGVFIEK